MPLGLKIKLHENSKPEPRNFFFIVYPTNIFRARVSFLNLERMFIFILALVFATALSYGPAPVYYRTFAHFASIQASSCLLTIPIAFPPRYSSHAHSQQQYLKERIYPITSLNSALSPFRLHMPGLPTNSEASWQQ